MFRKLLFYTVILYGLIVPTQMSYFNIFMRKFWITQFRYGCMTNWQYMTNSQLNKSLLVLFVTTAKRRRVFSIFLWDIIIGPEIKPTINYNIVFKIFLEQIEALFWKKLCNGGWVLSSRDVNVILCVGALMLDSIPQIANGL